MNSVNEMMGLGAAGTEGARRATGVSAAGARPGVPDPMVSEKATRRRFTAEYKLRILREADRCKAPGDIGALLRREGLYSSLLSIWRRERDRVAKSALSAKKRGPKAKVADPRLRQLEQENLRLKRKLEQAEALLAFQKKVSELLGIPLKAHDLDEND
jgi:transposase